MIATTATAPKNVKKRMALADRPPPSTRAAGHGPELVGLAGAGGHPDHVLVGLGDEELASVPPYCDRRRGQKRRGGAELCGWGDKCIWACVPCQTRAREIKKQRDMARRFRKVPKRDSRVACGADSIDDSDSASCAHAVDGSVTVFPR